MGERWRGLLARLLPKLLQRLRMAPDAEWDSESPGGESVVFLLGSGSYK